MEKKMYEFVCGDHGDAHYTVRSTNLDEVLESAQQHVKRIHGGDISLEEVRKLVHEFKQPVPGL